MKCEEQLAFLEGRLASLKRDYKKLKGVAKQREEKALHFKTTILELNDIITELKQEIDHGNSRKKED